MFKFVVLPFLFAAVNAGLIGAPIAYSAPVAYQAPVAYHAPIAVKAALPVATSYQNTYQISSGAVAVAAPTVVKAAPVAVAAPVLAHAAPYAVGHASPFLSGPVVHSVAAAPVYKAGPIW